MVRPVRAPRGPRGAALAAVLVALLALAGSVTAADHVRHREHTTAQQDFQTRANAAVSVARQEISRYTEALQAAGAFAANAGTLDPAAIARYVQSTDLFGELPTLTSLLFATRVPEADLDRMVQDMNAVTPGFSIIDLGSHEPGSDHWIITAYVPGARDFHIPRGVDVSSLPGLGEQAQHVGSTGRSAAASFRLTPGMGDVSSDLVGSDRDILNSEFFLVVPNFAGPRAEGQPPAGMVIAAVRGFAEEVATTANLQFDDLGFALTVDLDGLGVPVPAAVDQISQLDGRAGPRDTAVYSSETQFTVDGMQWTMDAWRGPTEADRSAVPWLVLGFGALSSLLVGWAMYLGARSAHRARLLRNERAERAQFQEDIVQSVADAMVVLDHDGAVVVGNRAWDLLVVPPDGDDGDERPSVAETYLDAMGRTATASTDELAAAVQATLAGRVGESNAIDVPVVIDGSPRWLAVRVSSMRDDRGGALIVHNDITDRREEQDSLVEQARRDPLTGLANRDGFTAGFADALAERRPFALLYIDLNRFKAINDRYGHGAGDTVLVAVASRIRQAARADDVVARLGGDEFAVLVTSGCGSEDVAAAIARRIEADIAEPIAAGHLTLRTAASVGFTLVDPTSGDTIEAALERADRAMYAVKQATRDLTVDLDSLER